MLKNITRCHELGLIPLSATLYHYVIRVLLKGIGPQTIVCAFYESLHVAEQFATNFMKINQGIRKL